jgi:hypothetical protein
LKAGPHRGQVGEEEPADLDRLVVCHVRGAGDVSAPEGVVQVLSVVAVDVNSRIADVDPDKFLDNAADPGLFEHLSHRCLRWVLARIYYAGHRSPRTVVGTPNQQDCAVVEDDRRHARKPQKVMTNPLTQAKDELGNWHAFTVIAQLAGLGHPRVVSLRR